MPRDEPSASELGTGVRFTVVIPARYQSSRFPGKPLAQIAGRPMIQHVIEAAKKSYAREVIVATDDWRVAQAAIGADTVLMTRADHPTGTDRMTEVALARPHEDVFVNVQGDCPLMPPGAINHVANMLHLHGNDMATLCTDLDPADVTDTSVVKVVPPSTFTRAPVSELRHIGIYAYTRDALARFASAPQSENERREGLEQLRAVDIGLNVGCYWYGDTGPEVNTPADLDRVAAAMGAALCSGTTP